MQNTITMKTRNYYLMLPVYLMLIQVAAGQQWLGSSSSTGDIYRDGYTGLGTSAPATLLDVEGVVTAGIPSATTPQMIVEGGAVGKDMLTLRRTVGTNAEYGFSVNGGGLTFHDALNNVFLFQLLSEGNASLLVVGSKHRSARNDGIITAPYVDNTTDTDARGGDLILRGGLGTGNSTGGSVIFQTAPETSSGTDLQILEERMRITKSGNVGIGTSDPGPFRLAISGDMAVDGDIKAREVEVKTDVWSDFVFGSDYSLMSLQETESYIRKNGHLPGIPSAQEVINEGIQLGEMNRLLLQKIEELTLHMIELEKQNRELKKQITRIRENQ